MWGEGDEQRGAREEGAVVTAGVDDFGPGKCGAHMPLPPPGTEPPWGGEALQGRGGGRGIPYSSARGGG